MKQPGRRSGPEPARRRIALGRVSPWLIFAVSVSAIGASVLALASAARSRDRAWFEHEVEGAADRIMDRVDMYRSTLRGAAGLFAADDSVSAAEFAAFVGRLNVQELYPGIRGVGWSRRLARFPGALVDERHRIEYLEPLDERNRAAIGFDMYAEPVRRAAMQLSRDRGGAALSRKVTLMQEIGGPRQPGFLIYLPLYQGGGFPATPAERRRLLLGFVYAPFRAHDFFRNVLAETGTNISVAVYDGASLDQRALLYASPRDAGHTPRHRKVDRLFIAGHQWTVAFESRRAFEARLWQSFMPVVIALALVAAALLFLLARSLARALHAAEAANRAKNAFLATMSHELRTPLNAIIGYADLLDAGVPQVIGDQARAQVNRIQYGAQHLLALIEAVLTLARSEVYTEAVHLETVDIRHIVNAAIELTRPLAARKGLRIECTFDDSLVPVRTDTQKVRQILVNLIGNAIKFTGSGEIRIEAVRNQQDVLLQVRDCGIGIASDQLEHIFHPFWQADQGHTRRFGGSGLGLAVSRNLARLLGGDITVVSAVGQGSTFTVHLPQES